MNKYQNKYRIPSARLQNWDYGAMGSYFVTICTQNREHFFGEIAETPSVETPCMASLTQTRNEMILNDIGKKVEEEWLKTIELRPDMNLELGNFVVMPNHFHGILIIGGNEFNTDTDIDTKNKFGPQSKNLGSIIRGFKSAVTMFAKTNVRDAMHRVSTNDFGWQPRFHDHIIRNSLEFERIQNYIANNVENWNKDKFYK
jgi:putative transposase